jgi:hypothetical protein
MSTLEIFISLIFHSIRWFCVISSHLTLYPYCHTIEIEPSMHPSHAFL